MKTIKLYFSEGKSDKVYEVDLRENQDLFVVNFRFGRRGDNLRVGTKTVFLVSYEESVINGVSVYAHVKALHQNLNMRFSINNS